MILKLKLKGYVMKIKLNYLFAALISFSSFNVIAKNNSPCDEFFSSSEEKAILDFKKQVDEVVISKIIEEYKVKLKIILWQEKELLEKNNKHILNIKNNTKWFFNISHRVFHRL